MRTPTLRLACLLLALLVTGCGYSLRGSDVLSSQFDSLQLSLQTPNSELSRLLRRSLDAAGVTTTMTAPGAAINSDLTTLAVGNEQLANRPVSVNPRARAAQYEIRLSIEIVLSRGDEDLIPRETLSVQRNYFEDIDNITGNRDEVQIITAEMRRELVDQLLRRLQAPALQS